MRGKTAKSEDDRKGCHPRSGPSCFIYPALTSLAARLSTRKRHPVPSERDDGLSICALRPLERLLPGFPRALAGVREQQPGRAVTRNSPGSRHSCSHGPGDSTHAGRTPALAAFSADAHARASGGRGLTRTRVPVTAHARGCGHTHARAGLSPRPSAHGAADIFVGHLLESVAQR